MSFLSSFKKLFRFGADDAHDKKKGQWNVNIKKDTDPTQLWEITGEIGEGAFGAVYKVTKWKNNIYHLIFYCNNLVYIYISLYQRSPSKYIVVIMVTVRGF